MRLIDADALNDAMYHEAFENDDSYDERNPMARWDSGCETMKQVAQSTKAELK